MLRDQQVPARVYVKGARVDLLGLDVLDRCRLAGRLVNREHDDAVFTTLEDLLALKLDGGLGAICPVHESDRLDGRVRCPPPDAP